MNLVIALLSTRTFITADRIRETVYGYSDEASDEAFSRMFERDKNELRDLGIPLETGRVSQIDPTEGYRINREAYALPAVELTADEAAAVAVATQLWESPELITATQGALLKLRAAGVDVDAGDAGIAITSTAAHARACADPRRCSESCCPPSTPGRPCSSRTGHRAASRTSTRTVEPWGVVTDRGRWYLVGHDRDRDATRTFRLSRIGAEVTPDRGARRGQQAPGGVDLREIVRPGHRRGPTGDAGQGVGRRRAGDRAAPTGARARARGARRPRRGGDRMDIDMSDRLAREIASYGADAVVLEPQSLREEVIERLRAQARRRASAKTIAMTRSTRLVRLLNMVPYFQANPRITYAEAAVRPRRERRISFATTSTSCGCAGCRDTAPAI